MPLLELLGVELQGLELDLESRNLSIVGTVGK